MIMIGMDFISFLILLIISVIVSLAAHYGLRFYVVPGLGSFFGKVVIGWVGAWLGSPVFGYWFGGLAYQEVYFIPAILGSVGAVILAVDVMKSFAAASGTGGAAQPKPPPTM